MNPSSLDVLVVGSGLSAYGALLKLIDIPNITITLFDIGLSSLIKAKIIKKFQIQKHLTILTTRMV